MDQISPDRATPETDVEPEPTGPAAAPEVPAASSPRTRRIEARLAAKAGDFDVWARAWISRSTRAHRLLASRTLDFAVLGDDALTLISTGFFSRRPRRRVYRAELHDLVVADDPVTKGRRLRFRASVGAELWMELGDDERSTTFADALVARTARMPE